jgi:hypothetical protein
MNDQNTNQTETQPTQPQSAPQPIIINNVTPAQSDDSGKKKAPGFLKVLIYSCLTSGIYLVYYIVKMANGGYRKR